MKREVSLTRAEIEAQAQIEGLGIDIDAFAVVSNVFRVANAVRNYTERSLLGEYRLSFSGFTVLWVLWVWGPKESHSLAEESGISKSTLTGVVKTLERLGFAIRRPHAADARRVLVQATDLGISPMCEIFSHFNALEGHVTRELSTEEMEELTRSLRVMLHSVAA